MARSVKTVIAAKGKKVIEFNLEKDAPSDEDLVKLIVGPSGNLRAPALRSGKRLFIGYHLDALTRFLS